MFGGARLYGRLGGTRTPTVRVGDDVHMAEVAPTLTDRNRRTDCDGPMVLSVLADINRRVASLLQFQCRRVEHLVHRRAIHDDIDGEAMESHGRTWRRRKKRTGD